MSLEDYEIIKQIGTGTYSIVYQVRCRTTSNYYAMKEIKFDRLSPKEKEYTKTEVKILKALDHPNIIKYEKSFKVNNNFCIIMELAQDGDLQKKIQKFEETGQTFSTDTIWKYTFQVISGLSALHSNKILHRDIKASNIFLMENDVVKIGDFNIGKEVSESTMYTKIGTPVMMSPEIWNGEAYNFKTDIWSLGCLVYQMATLKPPFLAESYAALYLKISKCKVPNIPNYPKNLNVFIQKLLKKNPKQRPSCVELLKFEEFKKMGAEAVKVPTILPGLVKLNSLVVEGSQDRMTTRKHHKSELTHISIVKVNKKSTSEHFKESSSPGGFIQRLRSNNSPSPNQVNLSRKSDSKPKIFKDFSSKVLSSQINKLHLSQKKKISAYIESESPYSEGFEIFHKKRLKSNHPVKKSNLLSDAYPIVTISNKRPESNLKSYSPGVSPKLLKKVESMSKVKSPN